MKALETAPGLRQGTRCVKQRTQDCPALPSCPQAQPGAQGGSGRPPCPSPPPQHGPRAVERDHTSPCASAQDMPLWAPGAPGVDSTSQTAAEPALGSSPASARGQLLRRAIRHFSSGHHVGLEGAFGQHSQHKLSAWRAPAPE